jgi:RimJ/RimL family protein N-acetyltransferase
LGICISPEFQGKGYATASLKLAEEYLKGFFSIRKITLKVLASNNAAILFYKKNGFNNCGTYSEHFFQNGSFQDVVLMEKFL